MLDRRGIFVFWEDQIVEPSQETTNPLKIPTPTPEPDWGGPLACLSGPVACLREPCRGSVEFVSHVLWYF